MDKIYTQRMKILKRVIGCILIIPAIIVAMALTIPFFIGGVIAAIIHYILTGKDGGHMIDDAVFSLWEIPSDLIR